MNKKILGSALLIILVAVVFISLPLAVVYAQSSTVSGILNSAKGSLVTIGGSLATIAFIVAGIMYLSATGNPSRMTVAKGALVAGVVGIVIIILANNACGFVSTFFGKIGSCGGSGSGSGGGSFIYHTSNVAINYIKTLF